jgi:hypothetical protein
MVADRWVGPLWITDAWADRRLFHAWTGAVAAKLGLGHVWMGRGFGERAGRSGVVEGLRGRWGGVHAEGWCPGGGGAVLRGVLGSVSRRHECRRAALSRRRGEDGAGAVRSSRGTPTEGRRGRCRIARRTTLPTQPTMRSVASNVLAAEPSSSTEHQDWYKQGSCRTALDLAACTG